MGLDLLSKLFAIFMDHLGTPKAALLLPDESGLNFVPWVSEGIDRTTQHRLRFSREFLEGLPGLDHGTTAAITGNRLHPLKAFFSNREYALVKTLRITPFLAGDRFPAALLVIDSESRPNSRDLTGIEAAGPAIAAKIEAARAILGNGTPTIRDEAVRSRLTVILREAESVGFHVTVVRIDLDRLAVDLLGDSTSTDTYRFKLDLAGAFSTMVSGSGELLSLGEHSVLLVIQSKNPYSERLLVHQFAEGVRTLFADPPALRRLTEHTWRYPAGESSIEEVVDSILE